MSLPQVSSITVVEIARNPKTVGNTHENGHKTRKRRIFSHIYQTCNGTYRPCKSSWNAKTMGNNTRKWPKHENDEFYVITLNHVSVLKIVVNCPRTPKQWAIAHQNGHKTRKRRFSCHFSQTCKGYYGP